MNPVQNNKARVFINTFLVTAATVIEKLLFFFITVLIARYLTKEQYGEYSTALGLATFLAIFSNLSIGVSVVRAININRNYKNEYFTGSLLVKIILSALTFIALIIALYFTDYNRNTVLLTLILGLVRIGSEFIVTLYSYFEADEKFKFTSVFSSLFSLAYLAGTYLVIYFKGDYFDIVDIRLLITIAFLIIIFLPLIKFYSFKFNYKVTLDFLKSMLPFSISFILGNVLLNLAIILLPLIHGTIYAGVYQNAFIFLSAITFIPTNLIRVLTPFLYKYPFNENKDKFQFAFNIYSKLFAVMSFYLLIIFYFYSSDIITLIFGQKYTDSVPLLRIFAFSMPFVFSIGQVIITTIDKQKVNTINDTITIILNLIISYLLIFYYKAEGAALSFVVIFIIIYILAHGYLISKRYVNYLTTFLIRIKLLVFCVIVYLIHTYFFTGIHFLISMLCNTLIYCILVILFIVKQDDIRIIKEITGKQNS